MPPPAAVVRGTHRACRRRAQGAAGGSWQMRLGAQGAAGACLPCGSSRAPWKRLPWQATACCQQQGVVGGLQEGAGQPSRPGGGVGELRTCALGSQAPPGGILCATTFGSQSWHAWRGHPAAACCQRGASLWFRKPTAPSASLSSQKPFTPCGTRESLGVGSDGATTRRAAGATARSAPSCQAAAPRKVSAAAVRLRGLAAPAQPLGHQGNPLHRQRGRRGAAGTCRAPESC